MAQLRGTACLGKHYHKILTALHAPKLMIFADAKKFGQSQFLLIILEQICSTTKQSLMWI